MALNESGTDTERLTANSKYVDLGVYALAIATAQNGWQIYGRLIVYWNGRVNEGTQRQMDEHTMNDAWRRLL
jgi:hypothetical protein